MPFPNSYIYEILLADDDKDDCLMFKDALDELSLAFMLTVVHNGQQLMDLLNKEGLKLPDILFLDLNMPRKTGFECLTEIKKNKRLSSLPVIIISTSFEQDIIQLLYKTGAQHYIRKPNDFSALRTVIAHAIKSTTKRNLVQPPVKEFVISSEAYGNEDI